MLSPSLRMGSVPAIRMVQPVLFAALNHVQFICRLTELHDLPAMPHLRSLQLQDNHISSLAPISSCPHLTLLDISFNCLTSVSQLGSLACLTGLQQLHLAGNDVQNAAG